MINTGIDWIGCIPDDWQLVRVKHIFNISKNLSQEGEPEKVLKLARAGIVEKDVTKNEGQMAASYIGYNIVRKNDLLLNPMDLVSGANCNVSELDGVISPAYTNLRAKDLTKTNPKFMDYYFKTQYNSLALFAHGKGVSFDNRWTLNTDALLNYFIPYPSLKIQNLIVDQIRVEEEKITRLIQLLNSQITKLKDYKHSLIVETVTHGLSKDVSLQNTDVEWASTIPSHWNVMPNKYVMKKIKNICEQYSGEDVLSLSVRGVNKRNFADGGKMPTTFDGYQYIEPGNLLMCLFDYDVTPRCIGLIKNYGVTSPAYSQFQLLNGNDAEYYYYYYLMIDDTKELLHLAKNLRHSFTEEQLGLINTIVPPIAEQREIAKYLNKKCGEIDALINIKLRKIEKLNEYKKSLIYEYVTGKREVKED